MTAKRFMNKTCGQNMDLSIKIEEAQFYLFFSTTAN